jgi:lysophospholipase L1-like esterase
MEFTWPLDIIPMRAMGTFILLYIFLALAWSLLQIRGRLPSVLGNRCAPLLANAAFVLLFFAGMEAVCRYESRLTLRTYPPDTMQRSNDALFWDLNPSARGTIIARKGGPWEGKSWSFTINSQGFRSLWDLSEAKEPGEARIMCLGDSTAFGYSVGDRETYSSVLEEILRKRFPGRRITVINAGVPGYCLYQSLLLFRQRALRYHPDIVVVKDCGNQDAQWSMKRFYGGHDLGATLAVKDVLHRSAFYLYMKRRIGYTPDLEKAPPPSAGDKDLAGFDLRVLREFARLCEVKRIAMVFLQINMNQGAIAPEQLELFRLHNIPVVAASFRGAADKGIDDNTHPGPLAHRDIATLLAEKIAPLVEKRLR